MITVQTCPTHALEKLVTQFERPKTFTESVILRGAAAEIASRNTERTGEADTLREDFEESQQEIEGLEKELEKAKDRIAELEADIKSGGSSVESLVEAVL